MSLEEMRERTGNAKAELEQGIVYSQAVGGKCASVDAVLTTLLERMDPDLIQRVVEDCDHAARLTPRPTKHFSNATEQLVVFLDSAHPLAGNIFMTAVTADHKSEAISQEIKTVSAEIIENVDTLRATLSALASLRNRLLQIGISTTELAGSGEAAVGGFIGRIIGREQAPSIAQTIISDIQAYEAENGLA
jgi:hypothetical protein